MQIRNDPAHLVAGDADTARLDLDIDLVRVAKQAGHRLVARVRLSDQHGAPAAFKR